MPSKKSLSSNQKYVLPLGFTLIILLMMGNVIYTVTQMRASSDLMFNTFESKNTNSSLLRVMSNAALSRSVVLGQMIDAGDPFVVDELNIKLNELATIFTFSREEFVAQKNLDPILSALLTKQGYISRDNVALQNKVYELLLDENKEKAMFIFHGETLPRQKAVLDVLKEMEEHQVVSTSKVLIASKKGYDDSLFSIMVFDTSTIFFSIFLAIYLLRKQKLNDKKLAAMATTDILTRLPNRFNFTSEIDNLILSKPYSTFAIIFFDIDYFKSINDNYGHDVGDRILKLVSAKLKSLVNEGDILSRFGGDEFVLLLQSISSVREAREVISEISSQLDSSFLIDGNEIFITLTMGVSVFPADGKSAKSLLNSADIAMYSAKESGRNCFQFFSQASRDKIEKDHAISHALHTILRNKNAYKELYMLYQPLVDMDTGETTECEALIRWTNTHGQEVSPEEFIPLAEKSNLIEKINLFVIDEVCKQQHEWQLSGAKDIRVNINLSGNKTIFRNLLSHLKENIIKYNLKPSLFGIELTERTLFDVSDETVKELGYWRNLGVKISIDDFGTGYSALNYLKKLPISTLKIDRGFISGLPEDMDDHALVKAIISLGHSLDLDIVAEGVETIEQLQFLKQYGCNSAQGFFLHHPLNSAQLKKLRLVA